MSLWNTEQKGADVATCVGFINAPFQYRPQCWNMYDISFLSHNLLSVTHSWGHSSKLGPFFIILLSLFILYHISLSSLVDAVSSISIQNFNFVHYHRHHNNHHRWTTESSQESKSFEEYHQLHSTSSIRWESAQWWTTMVSQSMPLSASEQLHWCFLWILFMFLLLMFKDK